MVERTFPLSTPARVDNAYPYGFCPKCGCYGALRERRPDGHDSCAMGHKYPSRDALAERPTDLRTLIQHRIERYKSTRPSLNTLTEYDQGIRNTLEWIESDLKLCLDDSDKATVDAYLKQTFDGARLNIAIDRPFNVPPKMDDALLNQRIAALETEVRRLNNAARHMRAKLREALEGEG